MRRGSFCVTLGSFEYMVALQEWTIQIEVSQGWSPKMTSIIFNYFLKKKWDGCSVLAWYFEGKVRLTSLAALLLWPNNTIMCGGEAMLKPGEISRGLVVPLVSEVLLGILHSFSDLSPWFYAIFLPLDARWRICW